VIFYEPATRDLALLPRDPFKALIAPRPIGWISTVDAQGRPNLAPYSFFNAVSDKPAVVAFSSEGEKDTLRNVRATGEFVCSLATYALRDAMNASAATLPQGVSEYEHAGLETAACMKVKPPRVAASPWSLECVVIAEVPVTIRDGTQRYVLVLGEVVGVHIDERYIVGGKVDTAAMRPIARGGYDEYAVVESVFRLGRPM
jgi:flavin reductase (DIM6/NTAB) family NADH-FMN oxidoreductase RutF